MKSITGHDHYRKVLRGLAAAVWVMLTAGLSAQAAMAAELAQVSVTVSGITAQATAGVTYLSLRILGPEGNIVLDQYSSGTSLNWEVSPDDMDGLYSWEANATTAPRRTERAGETSAPASLTWNSSGSFSVVNHEIVPLDQNEQGLLQTTHETISRIAGMVGDFLLPSAHADQMIMDDLIVTSSECIGRDCANGENFGFDTIRLKENNLRIRFYDTSNSGSFPTNDWQITANDSTNGGQNKFSIDDIDSARTPFTIEAGARANALYVDDGGRVGFGTSTPTIQLHVVDGNTPSLRMEQNGTQGWTPQTWDIAGNEAGFFVRDITNGSQMPFRIKPGADTGSLYIDSDNEIGMGTVSPAANLHVRDSVAGTLLKLEAAGTAEIPDDLFVISAPLGAPTTATDIFRVAGNGDTTIIGNFDVGSSRDLKQNIQGVSGGEAMDALAQLHPVHFTYKASPDTRSMGFIAEDVPDIVATNDRKTLRPMDIVALLTKVTQEQQKTIEVLSAQIAKLEQQMASEAR